VQPSDRIVTDGSPGRHVALVRSVVVPFGGVSLVDRIRVVVGAVWFLGSALGVTLLSGCTDETRQTGTQVKETEKDKAVVDAMRDDMMKAQKERQGGK